MSDETPVYEFGIRLTPKGAVAWARYPSGRLWEKRFRNGYASAVISAERWIESQIAVVREHHDEQKRPHPAIVCHHKPKGTMQ